MAQMCIAVRGASVFQLKSIPLFRQMTVLKKHTGTKVAGLRPSKVSSGSTSHELHVSTRTMYPAAKPLPLPHNVDDIDDTEVARFSPHRDRDISASVILSKAYNHYPTSSHFNQRSRPVDPHLASYDCSGALSLNSAMQTNVPEPFSSDGKSTHLNMPGGQWSRGHKYIADDLQKSHYSMKPQDTNGGQGTSLGRSIDLLPNPVPIQFKRNYTILLSPTCLTPVEMSRAYCTPVQGDDKSSPALSRKDKLKRAVKEYGTTVIVFHVSISLVSLGGCYLAVTSGVDMGRAMEFLGASGEIAPAAGQFVVAYAVHKMMAPVRISITLASTPFIVRYLRKIGVLKPPKAVARVEK